MEGRGWHVAHLRAVEELEDVHSHALHEDLVKGRVALEASLRWRESEEAAQRAEGGVRVREGGAVRWPEAIERRSEAFEGSGEGGTKRLEHLGVDRRLKEAAIGLNGTPWHVSDYLTA
jgi:hypothetical protein